MLGNYSTYRINSTTRNLQEILQPQGTSRADRYKASSIDCSRVSKHSTWQNKTPGSPTSIPGPYSTSRLPTILPGRNSILSGSQHPRSPYSSSQTESTEYYKYPLGITEFYQEKQDSPQKGLSIVCPCNTKVSVFQFTYSCAKNNSTRILILSRVLVILCKDTVHYLQSKLS